MRSPSHICEMLVSAPSSDRWWYSKARRFFLGLRTALRLVPRPLLACSTVPSGCPDVDLENPGMPGPCGSASRLERHAETDVSTGLVEAPFFHG